MALSLVSDLLRGRADIHAEGAAGAIFGRHLKRELHALPVAVERRRVDLNVGGRAGKALAS